MYCVHEAIFCCPKHHFHYFQVPHATLSAALEFQGLPFDQLSELAPQNYVKMVYFQIMQNLHATRTPPTG
jgi:hypothetical protein